MVRNFNFRYLAPCLLVPKGIQKLQNTTQCQTYVLVIHDYRGLPVSFCSQVEKMIFFLHLIMPRELCPQPWKAKKKVKGRSNCSVEVVVAPSTLFQAEVLGNSYI